MERKASKSVGIVILLAVAIIFLTNNASALLKDNITLYYAFDNGAGSSATDNSTINNPGSLVNSPSWTTGKVGPFNLNFTGASGQYVNSSRPVGISGAQPRTVSFWAQINTTAITQPMVGWGPCIVDDSFFITEVAGNWKVITCGGGDWDTGVSANTNLNLHTLVYNGSQLVWYINGVSIASLNRVYNTANTNLSIGMNIGAGFTTGRFDEVGMWNRSITSTEISQLYNSGVGRNPFNFQEISVSLNSPLNNTAQTNNSIIFNATIRPSAVTLQNATIYLYNQTGLVNNSVNLLTGTLDNQTAFSINNLPIGTYLWNVRGCSTVNVCSSQTNNNTLTIGATVNNNIFNSTTYETSYESFITNISVTSGQNLTMALLYYSGSAYTGTIITNGQDNILSSSIDIPLGQSNNTWFWRIFYNTGINQDLPTNNQFANISNFSICQSPNIVPYLNLTFKDEISGTNLNASVDNSLWNYYLGTGTVNKSYFYNNVSQNPSYGFCFSPPSKTLHLDLTNFRYSSTGYPTRSYGFTTTPLTNLTTNRILYLLSSADGIYSSILVVEGLGTTGIVGARVLIELELTPGNFVTVFDGTTDSSGVATAWLNPNNEYRYTVSASGFISQQFNLNPSQSIYTVRLQSAGTQTAAYNSSLTGYKWYVLPQIGTLEPGLTTFNLTLISYEGNLYGCRFSILSAPSLSILNSTTGGSAYGCNLSISYNTTNGNNIYAKLEINNTLTGGAFMVVDTDWYYVVIHDVVSTWTTITNFFSQLKDLPEFGSDINRREFSKVMFFFLISTVLLACFTYLSGFEIQNPGVAIVLIWFLVAVASISGFFTVDLASDNINTWIEQYGILLIYTFFALGYLLSQLRRQST